MSTITAFNVFDVLVEIYNNDYVQFQITTKREFNFVNSMLESGLIQYNKLINAFSLTELGLITIKQFEDRIK